MGTKRLYIFNCDCEMAIADGGKFYMPPANVKKMMEDLAYLPAYLGERGDCVLVGKDFGEKGGKGLQVECEPITWEELQREPGKFEGEPWGMSPKMCHWLATRNLGKEWREEQKEWYSRETACEVLCRLMKRGVVADEKAIPYSCSSLKEISERAGKGHWLVKAPWSSSGRGLLHLREGVSEKAGEWMSGVLKKQGYLMVERFLDKVEDFAMEFQASDEEIRFVGWSCFTTGEHGEYRGNYIGEQKNIIKRLEHLLGGEMLERLKTELPAVLREVLPLYRGFLGVDMMVYRTETGEMAVQPCVEINLRYNMGIMALYLSSKYLDKCAEGEFTVTFYSKRGEALQAHERMCREEPAVYKNNRIKSGYIALTPVSETTQFVASLRCY